MTEMSKKTARKYRDDHRLPSQRKEARDYRTRLDPFADVWDEVQAWLEDKPTIKPTTLMEWLQRTYPGRFPDSTKRTLERRVSRWRALHGPGKTVSFPQKHHPGRLAASDFTVCNELKVTIAGRRFEHMFFHCVLVYSNIQSVSLCFSESFEALSTGIQKAFREFGGVPQRHRTDSLSAAIRNHSSRKTLTDRYAALIDHYACEPEHTNARCPNENGDIESANGHFKDRVDQALLIRGSRDFAAREDYLIFIEELIVRANKNRAERFVQDQTALQRLPERPLETDDVMKDIRVSSSSTIKIRTNTYSVPSRLIGHQIDVRIGAEKIHVTYQGQPIQTMDRLFGKKGMSINYRHVIDSLVRKPGAFENYQYREEMFPTSGFRIAYDMLSETHATKVADKLYVKILELAAKESQEAVDESLRLQIASGEPIDLERIRQQVMDSTNIAPVTELDLGEPDLSVYDELTPTFSKESLQDDEIQSSKKQPRETTPLVPCGETSSGHVADVGPVSTTASSELSGALHRVGPERVSGEDQSPGVSQRADGFGMRGPSGGSCQAADDSIETSAGQDLAVVRHESSSFECETTTRNASGRIIPGSPGEHLAVREAGEREESYDLRIGGATDSTRTQCAVHDMQSVGSATVDCETGPAVTTVHQTALELRRPDHRRPGICTAESGGDGGALHTAGGTLRTRQCVTDKQSCVQQVGSNLQGRDDHSCGNRPSGSPQRDHRIERPELPRGNSQERKSNRAIQSKTHQEIKKVKGEF
jgi:hypothetical protein